MNDYIYMGASGILCQLETADISLLIDEADTGIYKEVSLGDISAADMLFKTEANFNFKKMD